MQQRNIITGTVKRTEIRRYEYERYESARLRLSVCVVLAGLWLLVMLPVCLGMAVESNNRGWYGAFAGLTLLDLVLLLLAAPRPGSWDLAIGFTNEVGRKWHKACTAVGLMAAVQGDKGLEHVPPKLSQISGTVYHWRALVQVAPAHGWNIEKYRSLADSLREAMGAGIVRFEFGDSGAVHIVYSAWALPVRGVPVPVPKPLEANSEQIISAVPIAHRADGGIFTISVEMHTLFAGVSGAGKSGYIWAVVLGLSKPVATGHVRIWGFDPKLTELAFCPGWFYRYAGVDTEMVELLEEAEREMNSRALQMSGKARKVAVSPDMPLNIILIDELADLQKLGDSKLQKRADKALQAILRKGRALGFIVVAAIQDPRKETLPDRDLYPNTIGLKLPASMIDLVLGQGAKEAGARCDQIPKGEYGGAGMAYAVVPGASEPVFMRAPLIGDDLIWSAWQAVEQYRLAVSDGSAGEITTEKLVTPHLQKVEALERL